MLLFACDAWVNSGWVSRFVPRFATSHDDHVLTSLRLREVRVKDLLPAETQRRLPWGGRHPGERLCEQRPPMVGGDPLERISGAGAWQIDAIAWLGIPLTSVLATDLSHLAGPGERKQALVSP